ncbi:MAG: hypothetical protein RL341_1579 [Pseudomonadota bacterium]|jgi:hypothetical protein
MNRTSKLMAALLASLLVAACGGGGGSAPPAPPPPVADNVVPPDAQGSVNGLLGWMKSRAVAVGESAEPFDLSSVSFPVSEDGEPDGSI